MLKVFYGWTKVNKIRKNEAISVIFENCVQDANKRERFLAKMQETVYVREQRQTNVWRHRDKTACIPNIPFVWMIKE